MVTILDKIADEDLLKLVEQSNSLRDFALKCGYTTLGDNRAVISKKLNSLGLSLDIFNQKKRTVLKVKTKEEVFMLNSSVDQSTLRRRYLKELPNQYFCSICGQQPEWQGKPLSLTLDHINGNNRDNRLENLRWVCPNCDRQLDTYGSKNRKDKKVIKAPKRPKFKSCKVQQIDPITKKVLNTYSSVYEAELHTGCRNVRNALRKGDNHKSGGYL